MKKRILRLASFIFSVVFIVITIQILPTAIKGYSLYHEKISQSDLDSVIQKLQEKKSYIQFEDIPQEYIQLLLKSEDKRFYHHPGVDPIAIVRSMYNNIKARSFVQGGSTITQQLAKNLYFSFEKKYDRKIAELFVAFDLEQKLTKNEILELYINVAYYGEGCYGLKDASFHYYGIHPQYLTKEQSSAIIRTLKCPNRYNPHTLNGAPASA